MLIKNRNIRHQVSSIKFCNIELDFGFKAVILNPQ